MEIVGHPITKIIPFNDSGQIMKNEKSHEIQKVKIEDLEIVDQYVDGNKIYNKDTFIKTIESNSKHGSSEHHRNTMPFFKMEENIEDRRNCDNISENIIDKKLVDFNCRVVLEKLPIEQLEIKNEDDQGIDETHSSIDETSSIESNVVLEELPTEQMEIKNEDEEGLDEVHSSIEETASTKSFQDIKIENVSSLVETPSERPTTSVQRRRKRRKDYCLYCKTMVLNFARHILRNHLSEEYVQTILMYPIQSSARKQLFDKLRKQGNFMYSKTSSEPLQKYCRGKALPCDNCLGFYSANLLWKHRNKCSGKKDRLHKVNAQNLMVAGSKIDPFLMKTVFPSMRPDEISMMAKNDALICAFGAQYIKIHRSKNFVKVASQRMRELARLLIEMKERDPSIKSLSDALRTNNFEILVESMKSVGKYNPETDTYKSPTYVYSLGTNLKQCIVLAIQGKHSTETEVPDQVKTDLKELNEMIRVQWKRKVPSQVTEDLDRTQLDNVSVVSLASDLRLLKECLTIQAQMAADAIHEKTNYQNLMETTFCRVLLLNRRRPEELLKLTVEEYETYLGGIVQEESVDKVSPSEKILWSKFDRVVVEDEEGLRVPILFGEDLKEHMKLLSDLRKHFVQSNNKYLFANIDSHRPLQGYKVLSKYSHLCGASNPESLISTGFREHLSTLMQVFSLSDDDLEQLVTFLGHASSLSRGYFRLPYDVYQKSKIATMLMSVADTPTNVFQDKPCEVEELVVDEDKLEPEISISEGPKQSLPRKMRGGRKKKRVLIMWTQEQKRIVLKFFAEHIEEKRPPKKSECMALKGCFPELDNKNWEKIKVFVQNVYTNKIKNIKKMMNGSQLHENI